MHLLVRLPTQLRRGLVAASTPSQCTFWCRVLTDSMKLVSGYLDGLTSLNAPSGAGCLPTEESDFYGPKLWVSMHLLVPGAYRHEAWSTAPGGYLRLNAPSGAGCLPTSFGTAPTRARISLNAPSGAGCLPTGYHAFYLRQCPRVSMHLLVPGAYRREASHTQATLTWSQCTFWCRVLTDRL